MKFVRLRLRSRSNRSINVYLINLIFSEVKLPVRRIFARLLILSSLNFNLMRNISRGNEVSRKKKRFHSTVFGLFLARGTNLSRNFVVTELGHAVYMHNIHFVVQNLKICTDSQREFLPVQQKTNTAG